MLGGRERAPQEPRALNTPQNRNEDQEENHNFLVFYFVDWLENVERKEQGKNQKPFFKHYTESLERWGDEEF